MVHLVGFSVGLCYDARTYERQTESGLDEIGQ
jgi:hypothetical protein